MWISKRKFQELEKRIADLEMAVRSQQKEITSLNYPYEDVKQLLQLLNWQDLWKPCRAVMALAVHLAIP